MGLPLVALVSGTGWDPLDLEELAQRVVDCADEAFGPFPVQTPAEAMTAIERGIFKARQDYESMRRTLGRVTARLRSFAKGDFGDDKDLAAVAEADAILGA